MEKIVVAKLNEVYLKISADAGVEREINQYFRFRVPNYQFMPKYQSRMWDGYVNLFDLYYGTLYVGLLPHLKVFASQFEYDLIIDEGVETINPIGMNVLDTFLNDLKLPFKPKDYQLSAVHHGIKNSRALIVSPTASGKSLMLYGLFRYYNTKSLILVPSLGLVTQMKKDFETYAEGDKPFKMETKIHTITSGSKKVTEKQLVISTWQSLFKQPKKFFDQFGLIIVDEAHQAKAKSITGIMEKATLTPHRFGFTGTLDGTLTNKMTLEGLFGKVFKPTTSKELMDRNDIAQLKTKCLVLKHSDVHCQHIKKFKYKDEINFINASEARNKFIRNLAISMTSNCLVTFQYIKHGKALFEMIQKKADPSRKIFFVAGSTTKEVREEVRTITEKERNAIIVASLGVFAVGINIRNLDNIIFASPSKARIRILQSIGRVLRKGDHQSFATLYDIVDDLSWKSRKNYSLQHFLERIKIYSSEKFDYDLFNIALNDK